MKSRTISRSEEINEIITRCLVCHVAMIDPDHQPYVLPMNFGYDQGIVYLHSAQHGKKIGCLKSNPRVCLAFSTDYMLRYQNEEVACSYGMKYKSVILYGTVEFLEDHDQKIQAMNVVMKQYTGKVFSYNMPAIREVCVYKVIPERVTGRAYGY